MSDSTIPLVQARNICKTFHKGGVDITVLQEASLELYSEDFVAIVGQSGSGKSTFLHILGALDHPSKGGLFMPNEQGVMQDVFTLPSKKIDQIRNQKVGFIFQFHHLLPDHTALRNVCLPLLVGGMSVSQAEAEALEMLKKVGLGHRIGHRPGELSGGEQQRVAIARALVHKPELVLADEPTGNLDPKTAASVMDLLVDLRQEVTGALVMVTHDHRLAQRCSKRLQLTLGKLEEWL